MNKEQGKVLIMNEPSWWGLVQIRHLKLLHVLQRTDYANETVFTDTSGFNTAAMLLTIRAYGRAYHDKRFLAEELRLIAGELEQAEKSRPG